MSKYSGVPAERREWPVAVRGEKGPALPLANRKGFH
jgi:hypothetical protein